jgi:CSLREA domain-containing protein
MMSTQTTTMTKHYFRAVTALVALAMLASLLVVLSAARPVHASTTFTVNLSDDRADASPGNGTCSVVNFGAFCTLRAAIQEANATPGADTINFNVNTTGDGVATISPDSPLPPITQTVTIDGYTQPGASPNTKTVGDNAVLKVQLDGTKVPDVNGLEIDTADSSVIKGLVINRFGVGISIGGDSVASRIEGNFIGTDPTGTLNRGNADFGVVLFNGPSETVVGGDALAARNVISGNFDEGILVSGSSFNRIQGNYVGTDKSGTKGLGNRFDGVKIESSSDTTIGGTTAASRNVISANGEDGLSLAPSNGARVLGNRIGTTASGTGALGNDGDGVFVGGSNNFIGDPSVLTSKGANTIAFNAGEGVDVGGDASTGNAIADNSIFSNGGLGIDLLGGLENAAGVTANDPGDLDNGPNNLQNFPVLTSARTVSGKTTITGKLGSTTNSGHNIQFFSSPSGNEGNKFLGEKSVTTDGSGNATFTFSPASAVPVGQTITATVKNQSLSTSEFSAPRKVTSTTTLAPPDTTKLSGPSGVTKSTTAHFTFASPEPDATFECSLDGGAYYACSSPENINGLADGVHTFLVRATDAEGRVDASPASWRWEVNRNKM